MELLAPRGLWLLSLLLPLVILHILKATRRRVPVASTWLWAGTKRDVLARSPFKRLSWELSLLLKALLLVAVALASSEPTIQGSAHAVRRVAVVVDVSASMTSGGTAGGTRHIELAKQAVLDLLDALPQDSEVTIIEAGSEPRLASGTTSPDRVRAAVALLQAREVEGDVTAALGLAADRLGGPDGAELHLVTDGLLARPPDLSLVGVPVFVTLVGEPRDNLAIVRADVQAESRAGSERVSAMVLVQNFGGAPRDVFVTMRRADASEVLDTRRLLVSPGSAVPVELSAARGPGLGQNLSFEVALADDTFGNALASDDHAHLRVPPSSSLRVSLVSAKGLPHSPWLERVLRADPGVELSLHADEEDLDLQSVGLLVADGLCPKLVAARGDVLVVRPPAGDCHGVSVGLESEHPPVSAWSETDPRMSYLSIGDLTIAKARLLKVTSPAQALVRSTAGALIADGSSPTRSVTIVGFDVGESDWPLKASFVLFMRNLTELARSHRPTAAPAGRSGEPLSVVLPRDAGRARVTAPNGDTVESAFASGVLVVPAVSQVGLFDIVIDGAEGDITRWPVNLFSPRESDLSRRADLAGAAAVTAGGEGPQVQRPQNVTWLWALLALVILLADVAVATRRAGRTEPRTVPAGRLR